MEHTLSAFHPELPHGAGLIMLSGAYFERVLPFCPERFADMAEAMGAKKPAKPEDFLAELKKLRTACGVDGLKMSGYGIGREDFGAYADNAMETGRSLFSCDREELSREDVVAIYEKSFA
jgi:alcohol dehydrogenase